jgi:hypothetical protein
MELREGVKFNDLIKYNDKLTKYINELETYQPLLDINDNYIYR